MLFLLNKQKVPSVARIIRIGPAGANQLNIISDSLGIATSKAQPSMLDRDAVVVAAAHGTQVVVGVTPTCPYGISACWGGAYEALRNMQGVEAVRPIPDAGDSVAYVYLNHDGLPDLQKWPEQFARTANATYKFRGVEVTLSGVMIEKDGRYLLEGTDRRPPVILAPLQAADRIQWDHKTASLKPVEQEEQLACQQLIVLVQSGLSPLQVTVTGPLKQTDAGYALEVRQFQALDSLK